ncbi:hypothetical protein F5Y12DRAFT_354185 [Xylaria sp. FL1777]|nr:hypothetical protein F5Y12DRAFT_354185 [Xylaria sp. FL1777]
MTASDDPRVKFGLSCPTGGNFYICQDSPTRFVGCCGVDPCAPGRNGECPMSELFNASFSADSGVMFLPQSCADPFNSSSWYTCDDALPPFLGCCTNNPCNNGCSAGHLVPAILSEDPKNASQLMLPETTTTAPATTVTSSATITSMLPAGTESSAPNSTSARAGMIAGISVAGVVVLLLVITAYLWVERRKQARKHSEHEQTIQSNGFFQEPPAEKAAFLVPNSNRSSHDPRATGLSTSPSENFHSPHLSLLSELEGSNGINPAPHQNLRDARHGSEGYGL